VPAGYAHALDLLHSGMRKLDVPTPHFTDRVERAEHLVANRDRTPAVADADRELLSETPRRLRRVIGELGCVGQLLHGEPHPGNVLTTPGPRTGDDHDVALGPKRPIPERTPAGHAVAQPDPDRARSPLLDTHG
jgi:hypothetical protein